MKSSTMSHVRSTSCSKIVVAWLMSILSSGELVGVVGLGVTGSYSVSSGITFALGSVGFFAVSSTIAE